MRVRAVADADRDHGDQEHLCERDEAVRDVVSREAVGVERGGEPDPPDRDERPAEPHALADPLGVGEAGAQDEDRGDEDEVEEQVEPRLFRLG